MSTKRVAMTTQHSIVLRDDELRRGCAEFETHGTGVASGTCSADSRERNSSISARYRRPHKKKPAIGPTMG